MAKKRKAPEITRDEWLDALNEAHTIDPINQHALTAYELAEKYKLSDRRMRERLRKMVEAGTVTVVRKQIVKSDGNRQYTTAYLLKKKVSG